MYEWVKKGEKFDHNDAPGGRWNNILSIDESHASVKFGAHGWSHCDSYDYSTLIEVLCDNVLVASVDYAESTSETTLSKRSFCRGTAKTLATSEESLKLSWSSSASRKDTLSELLEKVTKDSLSTSSSATLDKMDFKMDTGRSTEIKFMLTKALETELKITESGEYLRRKSQEEETTIEDPATIVRNSKAICKVKMLIITFIDDPPAVLKETSCHDEILSNNKCIEDDL